MFNQHQRTQEARDKTHSWLLVPPIFLVCIIQPSANHVQKSGSHEITGCITAFCKVTPCIMKVLILVLDIYIELAVHETFIT